MNGTGIALCETATIDAVGSALRQKTPFGFNVIVVDDHSADGTTDVLAGIAGRDRRLVHMLPERTDLVIGGCWNGSSVSSTRILVLAVFQDDRYLTILWPRSKHRPDCYFKKGDERIAVSPASMEMVGLCQIGAAVIAFQGVGYLEILKHYYPGTVTATVVTDIASFFGQSVGYSDSCGHGG